MFVFTALFGWVSEYPENKTKMCLFLEKQSVCG